MKKSTITVEEYEILKQRVTTLCNHAEASKGTPYFIPYSEILKNINEYLKSVTVLPEFKHDTKTNFTR